MGTDRTIQQCVNVAHLSGIYKYAITMPDGHEGYGFPIGGVAATDYDEGLISPGGVGYDINCGVRLIRTNLSEEEVRPALSQLVDTIFNFIPSGLGSRGQIKLSSIELDKAVTDGLDWAVDKGYAWPEDPKTIEEEGCMEAADPSKVSSSARSRGAPQLGSLGSGNHFVEIERADRIFDERVAQRLGIHKKGQILVLIHTGSRGYGHQICSDYLKVMERATGKYNIHLPDRELAACPSKSPEAQDYIPAMSAACNFAWVNRQMITHWARQAFENVFAKSADSMDMRRAASMEVVAEEAPDAYKDVDRVADVSDQLGIGKKVVRMTPIGVAKG